MTSERKAVRAETVFIVCQDYGYEGHGLPEAVFDSAEMAAVYKAGAGGYRSLVITELPVQSSGPLHEEAEG